MLAPQSMLAAGHGPRVKDLTVCIATKQYGSGLRNSLHAWNEKHAVLAFVETEGGVVGVGEAWCDGGVPETVASLIAKDLKSLVVGRPVWAIEQFHARALHTNVMSAKGGILYAAISAIDIALWDALARTLDQPLYRVLGGFSDSVPVYGSSGMYRDGYGPDALAREMADAIAQGCAGVKIKGGGAPASEDVARVAAVRAAIGPAARLMVDVMFCLSVPEAVRLGHALRPYDLHFLEAPTARADLRGWAEVRRAIGIPIAGPELESGLHVFRTALELGAVDVLQADACVCGGITEIRRIAGLAQAFHRTMTMHCSGSAVALAANAHVAAALHSCESIEMHLLHQTLFERLWTAGYRVADGRLHLPAAAGLGIDLKPDDPALKRVG
jgi:L-alanine-DL-glutamate epimerase-like enolase superfamily enzyme